MKLDILKAVPVKLAPIAGKLGKHSPEILLGCGIASIIGGTVMACRATLKVPDHVYDIEEELGSMAFDKMDDSLEAVPFSEWPERVRDVLEPKEKAVVYGRHGLKIAKDYLPAVCLLGGGIAMVVGGHNQLRTRLGAVSAAYVTLETAYSNYRERVIEDYGAEVDRKFRLGIRDEKVEETKVLKNGKEKTVTKVTETVHADGEGYSMYARYFDAFNSYEHTKSQEYNYDFLILQQNAANEKFQRQGYLFLNDVYDMLGFDKVPEGQLVGWMRGMGDDYVDFGIFEVRNSAARDFVNGSANGDGKDNIFVLDFNVDGLMWNRIGNVPKAD